MQKLIEYCKKTIKNLLLSSIKQFDRNPSNLIIQLDLSDKKLHLDTLIVEPSGSILLQGWTPLKNLRDVDVPCIELENSNLPVLEIYRTYRPDLPSAIGVEENFLGICITFLDKTFKHCGEKSRKKLSIILSGEVVFEEKIELHWVEPHYSNLLFTEKVLHRNHIYGSGPPAPVNHPEIVSLAKSLKGRILDFGCGSGYLVKVLREMGMDAYGIEIDRDLIVGNLYPEVKDYIKLYDGNFPLPYEDNLFDCVISSEVIEHIPNYETAIQEIARITCQKFIITVPDISSIPTCFPHNVVPWHLLELTHVNFFTQNSLQQLLLNYFQTISFAKIGPTKINNMVWYESLVGICEKV